MTNKKKCIDDVAGWASTLEQLFTDTAEFLTHTGRHGVVQNPNKFVWGKKQIEYLGFWITEDGIRPSDETLSSIANFPRPADLTGMRSWFGLIEQVSYAFSKSKIMEPFRELLKAKTEYTWTPALQTSFESARKEIVAIVSNGVKTFKIGDHTCLITDWSRKGIGYVLYQKRCQCKTIHPSCCKTGWVVISCGSRFCSAAEARYHPIEGELLAVAWALEKTGYFTLGSEKLLLLVDHKPLIGLLTTRELGDIQNPRLEHLAERLLRWTFTVQHIAGAVNLGPDALSRFPYNKNHGVTGALGPHDDAEQAWSQALEGQVLATAAARSSKVVSWSTIQTAGISDPQHSSLLQAVSNQDKDILQLPLLAEYRQYMDHLTNVDGVVLFKNRVVIPKVLRPDILRNLHRAHQGSTGMLLRAQESIWWPGYTNDVQRLREDCSTCRRNAPSQPSLPSVHPPIPDYPMQMLSSDYFFHKGKPYLVIVDRYSNWPTIRLCNTETARELISALREFFAQYGTPEELTTDGGSQYTSSEVQQFLQTWGVKHRISTAYNPHANLRAETAVKTMKRLISENTGPSGSLDTDSLAMAILNYRNTPDRDTHRSPAQILFARKLRDSIPCNKQDLQLRKEWILTREAREKALAKRHEVRGTDLDAHAHKLKPLSPGTIVQIQNQTGPHKNKWDKSGVVVEVLDHDAYTVKVDGSGRISKRNRRFLRPIRPYSSVIGDQYVSREDISRNVGAPMSHAQPENTPPSKNNNSVPVTDYYYAGSPSHTRARVPGRVLLPAGQQQQHDVSTRHEHPTPAGSSPTSLDILDVTQSSLIQPSIQANDVTHAQSADQETISSSRPKRNIVKPQRLIESM